MGSLGKQRQTLRAEAETETETGRSRTTQTLAQLIQTTGEDNL
jgi:hypothetical protein